MMLLDALDAFYLEHRRCGELDSEVTDPRLRGGRLEPGWVVMECSCGARIARLISLDEPA